MISPVGRGAPAVKICGLTRKEDGVAAAEAGADYLGMVASSGFTRTAPPGLGAALAAATDIPVVAVTVDESLDALVSLARECHASVLQLHGSESPDLVAALRGEGPWKLWKAVRVRTTGETLRAMEDWSGRVDGILLDGWHPGLPGGTGTRFPWEVVESVRDAFPRETLFVAAGGLIPENVDEAVRRLRPDVVDVSSGVERAPGIKDPDRVRSFIENAKGRGR